MAVKKTAIKGGDPLPHELLDILACPICKSDLRYSEDKKFLICSPCKRKYEINGEIPVLLP